MKRIYVITLLLSLFLPGGTELFAQNNGRVTGGLIMETTTIHKKEKPVKQPVVKKKSMYQQSVYLNSHSDFDDCGSIGFDYVGGARINRYFFLGFGVGLRYEIGDDEYNEYNGYNRMLMRPCATLPLYLNTKIYMGRKSCQPFFGISAGGNIALTSAHVEWSEYYYYSKYNYGYYYYDEEHGLSTAFFEPTFGVEFPVGKRTKMDFQIGVNVHGVHRIDRLYNGELECEKETEAVFSFKFGLTF